MRVLKDLLLAFTLTITLSCESTESKQQNFLAGTVWAARGDSGTDATYRQVLNFYDKTHVAIYPYYTTSGTDMKSVPVTAYTGTYSMASENMVTFDLVRTYNFGGFSIRYVYENGTISGNSMTVLQRSDSSSTKYVFYKQ